MKKKSFFTFLFGVLCGAAGVVVLGYCLTDAEINWIKHLAEADEEYEDDEDFDEEIEDELDAKYERKVSEVCPNFAE